MNKKKSILASVVSIISSGFAFLGIVSCCGFPMLASVLAWGGIGASQLGILSQYQHHFISIAILSLLYGFYTVYFKKSNKQSATSCCSVNIQEQEQSNNCCSVVIEEEVHKSESCCSSQPTTKESSDCCNLKNQEDVKDKEPTSCCESKPATHRLTKIMLWIGALAVLASLFVTNQPETDSSQSTNCCPAHINK